MTTFDDFTAGIATQAPRLVAARSKKFAGLRGCKEATNVILDEQGVRTAPGYNRMYDNPLPGIVRGLHYYVRRGSGTVVEEIVAISDGQLWADTTITWVSRGSGLTDAPKTRFKTFNGYAIFVNGIDPVKQYDGATVASTPFTDAVGAPQLIFPADARPAFVFKHVNRLFYMNDANYPYRFWTPDAETHNIFGDNSDAVDVNVGDGQPLVGAASLTNGVAVLFKTESIHTLTGSNPTDAATDPFSVKPFSDELGCVAPDTIISVGADVYFLSQRGYKRLRYVKTTGNITDADPLYPAQPTLDLFDVDRASEANACFVAVERSIYLSYPTKGGGMNTLVYNVVTEGIMARQGLNITNQIYITKFEQQFFTRVEAPAQTAFRVFINGLSNSYDGVFFASRWESLILATDKMNTRKFFSKFLAYTRVYNGAQVRCGIRLINVDGSQRVRYLDFGDTTGIDGWDIGKWDEALWDNAIANVLRKSRLGRGVAMTIFFEADAGAAFFFDRIEFDVDERGQANR